MSKYICSIALLLSFICYMFIFPSVWHSQEQVRANVPAGYVMPSKFNRILSLGHHGLLGDFLFLKTVTFVGTRLLAKEDLTKEDWSYVSRSLDVIIDLDPYFADPYSLAEGLLAWDAGMPKEANILLEKGIPYRSFDWRLPFYVGFNHYYFLNDYDMGSRYIKQASELPGGPQYLKTLAARLAYYAGKSNTALLFLKQMLVETDDPVLKSRLSTRLLALERAVVIEKALEEYKQKNNGTLPNSLDALVSLGYLVVLPQDPYGGKWGILKNGRVFSTSKFVNKSN